MEIDPIGRPTLTAFAPTRVSRDEQEQPSVVAAVRAVNKSELFGADRQLLFARDRDTHKPVIHVVDRNTGETVQQIPPAELLRILASLKLDRKGDVNP